MWFYDFGLPVFLLVNVASVWGKETIIIRSSDEVKENLFNDVLKNISSANKLLQELIKNYEQLQDIYKSNEDNSKTGNTEKEIFKTYKASDSNERDNPHTEPTIESLHVTQMIFDEDTEESDGHTNDSEIILVQSVEGNNINFNISESSAKLYDKTTSEESDQIEIITKRFNHTLEKIAKDRKHKVKSKRTKHHKTDKNIKTRYKIQNENVKSDAKRNFNKLSRPMLRSNNDRDGRVKRIVYAEIFTPDRLWQEVVHKPIRLKYFNDDQVNFRITGPNNNDDNIKENNNHDISSDSKPESETIEKEQLKSYLLRNAYGDACLQVAVRKCYKALKNVCKTVCRLQSKCKSSLKSSFKENSKKGCIKEFVNKNNSSNAVKSDEFQLDRRNSVSETSRYIELCLPAMRIGTQVTNEKDIRNDTNDYKTINALRDRFEKACQKLSAKKCTKACYYARDTACSTTDCGPKKKSFTKACKRECKQAYNLFKASSDSDDDDDDDEDDDDSDSD